MKIAILLLLSAVLVNANEGIKDLLYSQSANEELALSFIGVPEGKIETKKRAIKGELAAPSLINFATLVLISRNEQSKGSIQAILHPESLDFIEVDSDKLQILPILKQIESGSFLYLKDDPKFFVTGRDVNQQELDRYFRNYQTKPNRTIFFYHYNQEKGMLIGTQLFVVSEGQQYQIQLQIREPRSNKAG